MHTKVKPSVPFVEQFEEIFSRRKLQEPKWLQVARRNAFDAYRDIGLPDRKSEDWRYTHLNRYFRKTYSTPEPTSKLNAIPQAIPPIESYRIVFFNGHFQAELSSLDNLPEGVLIESINKRWAKEPNTLKSQIKRSATSQNRALSSLNLAYTEDGVHLLVAANTKLVKPIHIVSIGLAGIQPIAFHLRSIIEIGAGATVDILETHIGCNDNAYLSNSVLEILVDKGAYLGHYRLQDDNNQAINIGFSELKLCEGAGYEGFGLLVGAALARNEVQAVIEGEGVNCRINGAYLAAGNQHQDNTTYIDHVVGNSNSQQIFKGVLDDKARGVFQGKIQIEPNAQKTNGHQLNRTLLLSSSAEMNCKPELKIYADDVKCSHGATVAELEEEALFYLRSRGIDYKTARNILIEAFIADVTREIQNLPIRKIFENTVDKWLCTRLGIKS